MQPMASKVTRPCSKSGKSIFMAVAERRYSRWTFVRSVGEEEHVVVQGHGGIEHEVLGAIQAMEGPRGKLCPAPRRGVAHVQAGSQVLSVEEKAVAVVEDASHGKQR